ncbi:4Fe-4S binding protein [Halothermothrix orenii]|nr:4Fe-4S binding protein [Halothermothrix orenii]
MASTMKINKDKLRIVTEVLFLILFFFLFRNNSLQRWIIFFGAGIIISVFTGRFYCAWACPIGTMMRPISWLYKKLQIKRLKPPSFMKKSWIKWGLLMLFIVVMIGTKVLKIKFNLLLYLTLLGVLISLLFEEELWHKYICPYGTLFSVFTRPAKYGLKIIEEKCISCGKCEKVCLNNSISILANKKRKISNKDCLLCFKCQEVCSVEAISFAKV